MKIFILLSICIAAALSASVEKCQRQCPKINDPICGSDGETYPNDCIMGKVACLKGITVVKSYHGECKPQESKTRCIFPCNRMLAPVCGSDGNKYSNECVMRYSICSQNKAITTVRRINAMDFNDADCSKCPIACTRIYMPVCGSDGNTHSNECMMRLAACQKKQAIIIHHDGQCEQ